MDSISSEELRHRLGLIRCHLPTELLIASLRQTLDSRAITQASTQQLETLGFNPAQIKRIQQLNIEDTDRDMAWLDKPGHGILFFDDTRYPQQLLNIVEPPFALFYIGDPDFLHQPQLAMVGSRTPTAAGKQIAEDFSAHLSQAGITITSGLAHGIDTASHLGALKGIAGTIAVVANGLHTIYPKANTSLAQAISSNGCIVTESAVGTEPLKALFPKRNRIISGLSLGTLVTEAALNSGSLITTKHAIEQGREVLAIPGSIHNPLAKGCHKLIKNGAKLVESAEDILEELFPLVNSVSIRHTSAPDVDNSTSDNSHIELDAAYLALLKQMEFTPVAIDELVEHSNLSVSELSSMLLILELQGYVVSHNGLYSRASSSVN